MKTPPVRAGLVWTLTSAQTRRHVRGKPKGDDAIGLLRLYRDTVAGRPGPALDYIESVDDDETLGVSVHVVCELRAGAELSRKPHREHEALDTLLSGLLIVHPDERFAPMYGRLLASIRRSNRPIASMDLLIATAAVLDDAPLVTRNAKDFSRVPGLRIVVY